MAVISITITESTEQIVSGFPKSVVITANIASTIFYTLDGTTPTTDSDIYVDTLRLPTDDVTLVLKIYATNGTDSSPVITTTYQTNTLGQGARTTHSGTTAQAHPLPGNNPMPYGSPPYDINGTYLGAGEAGENVYDGVDGYSNGFDADGEPNAFTDAEFQGIASEDLPVILSESNRIGERGHGIGTLPARATIQYPVPPQTESSNMDKVFDPKAMVIFQDYTSPLTLNDPVDINRMSFSLEDVEKTRQGNQFFNVGPDTPAPTGTFLRQHFNPKENTMTYYYFDSSSNRWIISKTAYTPAASAGNYSRIVFGKGQGAGFVFAWRPFAQRFLY